MLQEIMAGCSFERGVLGFCRDRHLLPSTPQHHHRRQSVETSLHPQTPGNEMVCSADCVCVQPGLKEQQNSDPYDGVDECRRDCA